jgi:hypothetical protein
MQPPIQLATCFHAGFLFGLFNPEMEAIYSSETSVDFQRITRRYIEEDSTFHNHRCQNFKSSIFLILAIAEVFKLFNYL